ncbi:MAG: ABC transporter ATP-binding protein [Ruminococcus sp.]|jgi:ABC-2 type transport system ATP-binding protein|nr:ABC transporter ATP-binding protein [Ruminococcus sp.]
MTNAFEVHNLCKNYNLFSLKDVSFAVPEGSICGFIGPNGAGKTTVIKSILGLIFPDSGDIIIKQELKQTENKTRIGVILDNHMYIEEWKCSDVGDAIALCNELFDKENFNSLLKKFHIDERKKVKELSRGMKVKLQLAAALSGKAEILILDEPTSGLDPSARDDVCDILREFIIDGGKGVLFSTHITSDLEKCADYIIFINRGEILFNGPSDELRQKYIRITGSKSDLSLEDKDKLIGYREHQFGFEGLLERQMAMKLSENLNREAATLEEIIIFFDRDFGEEKNETN